MRQRKNLQIGNIFLAKNPSFVGILSEKVYYLWTFRRWEGDLMAARWNTNYLDFLLTSGSAKRRRHERSF